MPAPNPDEFLTFAAASREIGLCRETIAKCTHPGVMPAFVFGSGQRPTNSIPGSVGGRRCGPV
jgi:hypothetical protein